MPFKLQRNKTNILILLFAVLFLIILPSSFSVSTKTYHMKLLAVSELDNGSFTGSTADLYLDIKPGTGKVLMDTFPLTKSDTQLSTRFAKEMSCKYLDIDCNSYDFIYTIRSSSDIIGGPSAGAAISAMTVAALSDLDIDESVAVTGTINSGTLIGNVGGVKEKIQAAKDSGLRKVLIPYGENLYMQDNQTINLTSFRENIGIEVIEVVDLDDALLHLTGKNFSKAPKELNMDSKYNEIMESLAVDLCSRSEILAYKIHLIKTQDPGFKEYSKNITADFNSTYIDFYSRLLNISLGNDTDSNISSDDETNAETDLPFNFSQDFSSQFMDAISLIKRAQLGIDNQSYYSAASYCFGSNVKLHNLYLTELNYSIKDIKDRLDEIDNAIDTFDTELSRHKYRTITDFQTYMVVRERLVEAKRYVNQSNEYIILLEKNDTAEINSTGIRECKISITNITETNISTDNISDISCSLKNDSIPEIDPKIMLDNSLYYLSFAIERLYSARSWFSFYGTGGEEFDFNSEVTREACINKIDEVNERINYVRLFLPQGLSTTEDDLEKAKGYLASQDFELCLFKASLAKAQVNVILSMLGIEDEEDLNIMTKLKLDKAKEAIADETARGRFPILGYSYYEYALSLSEHDRYSAPLYAEYALELSNLDIYFRKSSAPVNSPMKSFNTYKSQFLALITGIIIGFLLAALYFNLVIKKKPAQPIQKVHNKVIKIKKKR